jgi:predicted signal transduction protein with EAL and GGDEF domain
MTVEADMRQTTLRPDSLPLLQRARLQDDGPCGWPVGSPVATLLLDGDDFRDLNERLGGETGDRVLAELADRLQERLCQCGVTTHLDTDRLGIRCEGLACGDPLTTEIARALSNPLRVGNDVVEVRTQVAEIGLLVGQAG